MEIKIPAKFQAALEILASAGEGRFACVRGYSPSTNYIVRPIVNTTFSSRFSTLKFYERMIEKMEALTAGDFSGDEKTIATFEEARGELVASMKKTLEGDRSDAHRAGHDRCYEILENGVKLHLLTEKGEDGLMHPVLDEEGNATAKSIMISAIEISKKTIKEGEYKKVKSQSKTIMKRLIEKAVGANKFKTFSLKEDNFDSLAIDGETVLQGELF